MGTNATMEMDVIQPAMTRSLANQWTVGAENRLSLDATVLTKRAHLRRAWPRNCLLSPSDCPRAVSVDILMSRQHSICASRAPTANLVRQLVFIKIDLTCII